MNGFPTGIERGIAYTFYSFKGGVGRSMALANVAALLAKWGRRVLVVDWDLEAPGLERFFSNDAHSVVNDREVRAGIVDLVVGFAAGESVDWHGAVIPVAIGSNGARVSLITAGRSGQDYSSKLQGLDFEKLFAEVGLGSYIEQLRNEWLAEYDFVLIDSRTGVTDIGGICTVQLADVLVLLFTTTEASIAGTKDIVERARMRQQTLPVDRQRLLAVPVPARDESRTEYREAATWKTRFALEFQELFADWLPSGVTARDAIEVLRIPYVPYWSFGERLPVVEEGTSDPSSLGHAYELLSRLLDARLDWSRAMDGQLASAGVQPTRRDLGVEDWLAGHRGHALHGLKMLGGNGYVEIYHACQTEISPRNQAELVRIAREAAIHTTGWPIGVVLNNNEASRPRPKNDGIVANINHSNGYDYWALRMNGDFYCLMTYSENSRVEPTLYFDTRIRRTAEMLLRCDRQYRGFGADPSSIIDLKVRYTGLRGRALSSSATRFVDVTTNEVEDQVEVSASVRLDTIKRDLVALTKRFCSPLFMLFDYREFSDSVYTEIVQQFVDGQFN